jgi:hypothetical protein
MRTRTFALLVGLAVAGCGGGASGDDDDDDDDDDAGDSGDTGDDASDDGGDDGSDDGGSNGTFVVTGTVAPAPALRRPRPGEPARAIDYVVAVTPGSQNQRRAWSEVAPDGSFSLGIDPDDAWVLVFVDSTRVGPDMIAGVLGAGTLDALTPTATGALELGDVGVSETGEATPGVAYDDLLAGLGLDAAAADYLGAIDDVCLRYVNPDVDGDGMLDVLEDNSHSFLLDFHVQRSMMEDGQQATVADLVGRFLDPIVTTSQFGGTGVYVSLPASIWAGSTDEAAMIFSEALYFVGRSGPGFAAPGTAVTGSSLIDNDYGDMRGVGVAASPGHDMPQGVYQAELGDTTLTFTNVATLSDAELASAEGTLLPFVRFDPFEEDCVDACLIAAVDIEWRKRTAEGWVLATADELALTVGTEGAFASIVVGTDDGTQGIGLKLPAEPSATVVWDVANAYLANIEPAGFSALTTDQICHFGLSYDDRLGMRHFAGIANAPGTCE